MYSDPISHLFDGIIPAYEHYVELSNKKDNKKSLLINTALDVAGKLFHFREELEPLIVPNTFKRSDVAALCSDFDWVGDVFNSIKHKELSRKSRIIRDKSHIEDTLVWTYFPYPGEVNYPRRFYSTVQSRILITPLPSMGRVRDLLEIATNVLNFWCKFLYDSQLTTIKKQFRYEGDDKIPESRLDSKGTVFYTNADGSARCCMIARYYEPETDTFERWGFTEKGELTSSRVTENAPNAKIYSSIKSPTFSSV